MKQATNGRNGVWKSRDEYRLGGNLQANKSAPIGCPSERNRKEEKGNYLKP
jgi:hypothetical protein